MRGTKKTTKRGFAVLDRDKARKDAPAAVKVLRRIAKDARADLSVDEILCNRLDYALDLVDQELNELLPSPGAAPQAKLPGLSGDGDGGAVQSSLEGGAETKNQLEDRNCS